MKERIERIMHRYGLNQTQFAERVGIQKSAMSHLFSKNGRGGNFSLPTIEKIIHAFPDINKEWLQTGIGEMLSANAMASQQISIEFPEKTVPKVVQASIEAVKEPEGKKVDSNEPVINQVKEKEKKKITQIVIFYDDNTFAYYKPE